MRLLLSFMLLSFVMLMAYQTRSQPQTRHNSLWDRIQHPFDTRLRYRIAEVDPRFGLTTQEVLAISQEATEIWKNGTGTDYFVYDPQARLGIYLIYDERQALSDQRRQQLENIQQHQKVWSNKRQNTRQLKQELEHEQMLLLAKKTTLEARFQQYHQQIENMHQNGGIHPAQRDAWMQYHHQLQQQIWILQQEVNLYNQKIRQLNQNVDQLNHMNMWLNQSIQQFNQRFQPRLFDKGLFNGKQIKVYEFESTDDLRLTLAHEFGHALGLKHNRDPQALMYPMLQEQRLQNFRLTQSDLILLRSR